MVVKVSTTVAKQLEAVRLSGMTNMLDRPRVQEIAKMLSYEELAEWIRLLPSEYNQAIFAGVEIDDEAAEEAMDIAEMRLEQDELDRRYATLTWAVDEVIFFGYGENEDGERTEVRITSAHFTDVDGEHCAHMILQETVLLAEDRNNPYTPTHDAIVLAAEVYFPAEDDKDGPEDILHLATADGPLTLRVVLDRLGQVLRYNDWTWEDDESDE